MTEEPTEPVAEREPELRRERQANKRGSRFTREGRVAASATLLRVGRVLPVVLILSGVGMELATAPGLTGNALFCAAPLIAAPIISTSGTALVGMLSVAAVALMRVLDVMSTGQEDITETASTGVVALFAVVINRFLSRSGAALSSARSIAEAAQFAVLPAPPSRLDGFEVAARYRAAQLDAHIGGDLYAVQETRYGIRMIVGDVRGKGMEAVEAVVLVIGAFREAAEQETTLEAVAERLERALHREGPRRHGLEFYEGFTTAALAEIPAANPELLRIVNRGHPPPLLLSDGGTRFIDPTVPALPLGLPELGRWPDRADEVPFPYGTQLLLYTDGLSEARDRSGTFFEPDKALADRTFDDPEVLLDAVLADVRAHTGGGTADDMALMAVQRRSRPE
ncbi:MAG: PP2C family protein-serine/threonine phosphatase [Streptomyces sp.]|uniref:PP2C family protein-serine/threonine phosphatase n=1 Tax=Streptomyces sp. TaxID=1931 RepID=UPI003D6B895B